MEAFEGFTPNDLDRWRQIAELQKKASSDIKGYYETMKALRDLEDNLKHVTKEKIKVEKKLLELAQKKSDLEKLAGYRDSEEYKNLLKQVKIEEKKLEIAEEMLRIGETNTRIISEQLNQSNLIVASTKSLGKAVVTVGGGLKANLKYWIDQQKSVKTTELNMGILSKQAAAFRDNIYKTSLSTNVLGVDSKMLAEMQSTYSEEMGRTVELSERGLTAMAELAKGTVLGAEGAARLAAEMDKFGISAEDSRDIVEGLLTKAHKIGVNGAKATKQLESNLKLANKYNFKEGINGLAKMAAITTKFKMDMSSIADFADKVFDVEGAVEMAAQLQVLGGGWSKLGDPFQLMFKARNDLQGFTEDIISATDVTGQFNKETGEFEITALELSRLREVAKATGIDFETLSNSAKLVAKNAQIKGKITGFFSDEEKEFIASLSTFDKKTKQYIIRVDGSDIPVQQMVNFNKSRLLELKNQQASLEERAKDSQTFDETWKNIVGTLKSAILPGFEAFSGALSKGLMGFQGWMKESGFVEKITSFGKSLGEFAASAIKWISDNPIKTMIGGITLLLAKETAWVFRGKLLGMGFNSVANTNGGAGGMLGTGVGANTTANTLGGKGLSGRMGKFGKSMAGKGIGVGLVGGALSMGADYWRENLEDPNSDSGKALGIGSQALAWGATGAMIGSVIPGLGTAAGAAIGAIGGAVAGAFQEYGKDAQNQANRNASIDMGQVNNDFIARPGADPIPFNSADTLVGLKKDGGLGKALIQGNNNSSGKMQVSFGGPIKIEGTINVVSNNNNVEIDVNNPMFIRSLSEIIQKEISRSISGGKISSNPIK